MRRDSAGFADVLSHAIRERDLPLDRIAQRLASMGVPVSVAALSYWRSGHSIPTRAQSLQALGHLERILDVKPGHLTHALPGRVSGGPAAVDTEHLSLLLQTLDLDLFPRVSHLVHHESVRVGGAGEPSARLVHQLQRCEVEGLTRVPAIIRHPDGADGPPPIIESVSGCRIGRTSTSQEYGVTVAEVFLAQPPRRGEHTAWTYRVQDRSGPVPSGSTCTVVTPIRHLVVDATLPHAPLRARYTWGESLGSAPPVVEELLPGTFMQRVVSDAAAGHHRLEWG